MKKSSITLTIVANMTSNYSEGLGNISSVQKVYRGQKVYAIRSRESLKNAIMVQSGLYDDLQTTASGTAQKSVTQKSVSSELNISNCRALEGGYMNTTGTTLIRKSSFYVTDAISCDNFINITRFHNNLYMASNFAENHDLNLQEKAGECGLLPYQYEYDKSLKIYSITIDLEMIGKDANFPESEAINEEKANRVIQLLDAVENLHLVVKGNLDNAEPLFIVGGLSNRKTHYFENVVKVVEGKLLLTEDLINKVANGYKAALLNSGTFINENEVNHTLHPMRIDNFFSELKSEVKAYYEV